MGNTVYIAGVDESIIGRDGLDPEDPIGSAGLTWIHTFDRAWAFDEQLEVVAQYISSDLGRVVHGDSSPYVVGSAATTLAEMQPPLDMLVLLSADQFADLQRAILLAVAHADWGPHVDAAEDWEELGHAQLVGDFAAIIA